MRALPIRLLGRHCAGLDHAAERAEFFAIVDSQSLVNDVALGTPGVDDLKLFALLAYEPSGRRVPSITRPLIAQLSRCCEEGQERRQE